LPLQLLILLVLAVAAIIFSVLTAIAVVAMKTIDISRIRTRERLYRIYSSKCSELLLGDLPPLAPGSKPSEAFALYESLIEPVKTSFATMSVTRRNAHRKALRHVLVDFAQDITGDSSDRLVYFFYSFGFVEEEIRLIRSRHWWVRAHAARSMGLLGAKKAIAALTAALEDSHRDVRTQAMHSLVKLVGPEALKTILRLSTKLSRWDEIELSVIIAGYKNDAVPHLVEALRHSDQSVVLFATEMLGDIGFVDAVDPLMKLAHTTKDMNVRAAALHALGRLGDERAGGLVAEFLKSKIPSVRLSALEALGRIAGKASTDLLKPFMLGPVRDEKLAAARALAIVGKKGISLLQKEAGSRDALTSAIAAQVLEEHGLTSIEA